MSSRSPSPFFSFVPTRPPVVRRSGPARALCPPSSRVGPNAVLFAPVLFIFFCLRCGLFSNGVRTSRRGRLLVGVYQVTSSHGVSCQAFIRLRPFRSPFAPSASFPSDNIRGLDLSLKSLGDSPEAFLVLPPSLYLPPPAVFRVAVADSHF